MGVLDSSYIKALGVKSTGLKKYFWFSGHPNVGHCFVKRAWASFPFGDVFFSLFLVVFFDSFSVVTN